ncbi:hypothetical protein KJ652_02785 [Patescibacteria group bacterium]|nr:hypothetical protein [Patescibacteria group bacterium]
MIFNKIHAGKWVATKEQKVIDSGRSLKALMVRMKKRKDQSGIRYSMVPKGCIAGITHGY